MLKLPYEPLSQQHSHSQIHHLPQAPSHSAKATTATSPLQVTFSANTPWNVTRPQSRTHLNTAEVGRQWNTASCPNIHHQEPAQQTTPQAEPKARIAPEDKRRYMINKHTLKLRSNHVGNISASHSSP
jgi:hypothetical protein